MNKSKKIKISIMAVLLIVTFFTGTFIRIKSCELHIRQVYWSTSDISEAVETKDYIITKNKNYYVNQKENDLKYKLIPEIDEGNKSVTNLVGSSESNIVYFLESKDNVNYIVEKWKEDRLKSLDEELASKKQAQRLKTECRREEAQMDPGGGTAARTWGICINFIFQLLSPSHWKI